MDIATPLAFGFGGPQDWAVIAVVALLVFGPKKLPEVGRQLGQAMREFNKLKDELTGAAHSIRDEVESAAQPLTKAYSTPHAVSSATVEAASARRVYDQEPEDMMAPVVPELRHAEQHAPVTDDGSLLTPPPAAVATADEAHEKGH
jgi:sec-independent protein translocase protein TatA